MSESVINEIPEIITEILDYEPKHRRYPADTLFKETSEVSLVDFLEKVESQFVLLVIFCNIEYICSIVAI